jgi:hypothetical protein
MPLNEPTAFSALTVGGVPVFGPGGMLPFTGNYWFVQENSTLGAGVAGGLGSANQPFNTLAQALTACGGGGNNDVIFLTGTVHVSATVAWNLNNTHLIGLCNGIKNGKRARISVTGAAPFSYLSNVTGSGCLFSNFQTFYGFPTTGATTPVNWLDTGGRNMYDTVEFLGFGDSTVTTGTANQTGARAFVLNTSTGETTWRNCVFGVDTIVRNATNYTLEIAGGAPRCTLEDCDFIADLGSAGSAAAHVLIDAQGIDRELIFKRCQFRSFTGGTAMAQVFKVTTGQVGGGVLLDKCIAFGPTALETTPSNAIYNNMVQATASGAGGIAVVN